MSKSGKYQKALKMKDKTQKFLGLDLYTPTIIAFIGYIILAITIILPFEYPVYNEQDGSTRILKYDFFQRLIMLLIMTIPIILSIYTINCMIGGNCILWSYVVTIMTILWIVIFVISAIVYTFHKKTENFGILSEEKMGKMFRKKENFGTMSEENIKKQMKLFGVPLKM